VVFFLSGEVDPSVTSADHVDRNRSNRWMGPRVFPLWQRCWAWLALCTARQSKVVRSVTILWVVDVEVAEKRCAGFKNTHVPRKTATWQTQFDDRILEFIAAERWSSPPIMAGSRFLRASEGRIRDRCTMLVYAGLLAPIHVEMYEVTRWGELYLDGDLDAAHQPVPTVGRVPRGRGP